MEDNKVRYSDEELEEFRQLINEKLAVAKSDYEVLIKKINGNGEDDEETHSTYHTLEEGSEIDVYPDEAHWGYAVRRGEVGYHLEERDGAVG